MDYWSYLNYFSHLFSAWRVLLFPEPLIYSHVRGKLHNINSASLEGKLYLTLFSKWLNVDCYASHPLKQWNEWFRYLRNGLFFFFLLNWWALYIRTNVHTIETMVSGFVDVTNGQVFIVFGSALVHSYSLRWKRLMGLPHEASDRHQRVTNLTLNLKNKTLYLGTRIMTAVVGCGHQTIIPERLSKSTLWR